MSESTKAQTTISKIGVTMFSVADQDAAIAFYTDQLGFELRADVSYGDEGAMRWVEVAPPGSQARLALCPPMGGQLGGSSIGVETPDVRAEHERLSSLDGVDVDAEVMSVPGAPAMFGVRDPDGNYIWVVDSSRSD